MNAAPPSHRWRWLAGPLLAGLAAPLSACTPAVAPGAPTMVSRDRHDEPRSAPAPASAPATPPPAHKRAPGEGDASAAPQVSALVRTRRGSISRAQLVAVLDRGPGAFLRAIEVRPHFRDRRFAGWQLVAISATATGALDLQPGDIILAVNERRIVRPRHLHALWTELRGSDEIVVQAEREGRPFELRFDVTDPPTAGP